MGTTERKTLHVVKLGGSILTDINTYKRCAEWLRDRIAARPTERIVAVVSAEFGQTDTLLNLAQSITANPDAAALDLLWATGELRSVALLTLNLHAAGVQAAGLNAHECGLVSPAGERAAATIDVNTLRIRYWLTRHVVVVVPGFLARGPFDTLVTLGRGGSDLTAVLLAGALEADFCELIKDVPGYFTADPHRDSHARPMPALTYAEALAMAAEGCDLVQTAAIEAAAQSGTPLLVRSLDEAAPYTIVCGDPEETLQSTARSVAG